MSVEDFSIFLHVNAAAAGRPSGEQFVSSVCQQYVTVTVSAVPGSYLHGLWCEFLHHHGDHAWLCSSNIIYMLTRWVILIETD